MAKQLLPEQCDFLHQQFPPPECCICNFKASLPAIVYALHYLDFGYEDGTLDIGRCLEIWETGIKPELEKSHFGDCTKEPQACLRCQAEYTMRLTRIIEEGLRG